MVTLPQGGLAALCPSRTLLRGPPTRPSSVPQAQRRCSDRELPLYGVGETEASPQPLAHLVCQGRQNRKGESGPLEGQKCHFRWGKGWG